MTKQPLFPHIPKGREPLFPHVPKGKETGIKTIDARGMPFPALNEIVRRYPAALYRQTGVSYSHDTREQDIREFRERAIREGAVVIVIQEYGQYAYVPIEKPSYLKEAELKHFWVEKNLPYDTWAIVEAWPGGTVRSPFNTKEEAIQQEKRIGEGIWELRLVPSPQEKFPKQHEALKKLYPYEFIEYHDDGDLTIQLLVPPKGKKWPVSFRELVKSDIMVVTTDGQTFKQELLANIELLAKTEGDPLRKFCCRQCGECAPTELLEEGRFPDRIAWLRSHYKEKHPGMWGKMSPMTVEDGELVSPEYRHLVGLVSEPLPKEAY